MFVFGKRNSCRDHYGFAWVLSIYVMVALGGLGQAETLKTVDLRTMTPADASKYYVVLIARKGSAVGHAIVSWVKEDGTRKQSTEKVFGFYPDSTAKDKVKFDTLFTGLPGKVVNEKLDDETRKNLGEITHRLILMVDPKVYSSTQDNIKRWSTSEYKLFSNNCNHFVAAVARDIGLIVSRPGSRELPGDYLSELIERVRK